jgi:hypothetical protein
VKQTRADMESAPTYARAVGQIRADMESAPTIIKHGRIPYPPILYSLCPSHPKQTTYVSLMEKRAMCHCPGTRPCISLTGTGYPGSGRISVRLIQDLDERQCSDGSGEGPIKQPGDMFYSRI